LQVELVGKIRALDAGVVALGAKLEAPVAQPHAGGAGVEAGVAGADTGRAFVVAQPAEARVGDGRMGEDQLARGEGARVAFAQAGAYPEEGDLEAHWAAVRAA
jgi:hypothetical protein